MTRLGGGAAPGYGPVADAFVAGLAEPEASGAALSVWHEGREVVDVWAGVADARDGRPWTRDTVTVLFSCSKGLAALVLARLHAASRLDLDAPIASVWPEFAAHGKGGVSVADVLAHRAGVSAPIADLGLDDVLDSSRFAARLAAQEPLWRPGTAHAYHAITYGAIVEEIVRRATGRELHDVFAAEIAAPLDADVSLMPDAALLARVAHLTTTPAYTRRAAEAGEWLERAATLGGAFPRTLVDGDRGFNDHRVLAAGLSAAGGIGTASGLARIWAATVRETRGVRLLGDDDVARLSAVRSEGPWFFDPLPPYPRWGAGVQLASDATPWLTPASFGHTGAGGQAGFADPGLGIGFGYVSNRMDVADRVSSILQALGRVVRR
ncbi:serine hydrolase domain-containing protein [Jiangella anatolica]|uniref:Carboxylesterase n=1 Tax=Jiangella anatolica TaxID=2670374 RepID=A0A2W2CN70_9ACTN|nr:serine hydrolase domain-containing protein [Jiangella anatolica]PZF86646.1 carboxylesterase [Jiangella anatolica]